MPLQRMVNVLALYHYCQLSMVQYQHTLESAIVFEADPVAAVVCYAAGLCAWNLRGQATGRRCNSNPGTCSCRLVRLWNVTGIQLTLRAFVAFLWHLTACFDGSLLQHRARQGNEWIHWQIFRYISFLLTIIFLWDCVNTPKCHMLLNRQVRYTPQPDDLVGFDLCVLLPQRLYLFSKDSKQWRQLRTWPCNLRF